MSGRKVNRGAWRDRVSNADLFEQLLAQESDDCIIWPRGTDSFGYGQTRHDGRQVRTHRLALLRTAGPPPPGKNQACHGPCHNTTCMNPRHLSWGDAASNGIDRRRDGTSFVPAPRRGEDHHAAKITWRIAGEIRSAYAAGGVSQRILATRYELAQATVYDIIHFHIWKPES